MKCENWNCWKDCIDLALKAIFVAVFTWGVCSMVCCMSSVIPLNLVEQKLHVVALKLLVVVKPQQKLLSLVVLTLINNNN